MCLDKIEIESLSEKNLRELQEVGKRVIKFYMDLSIGEIYEVKELLERTLSGTGFVQINYAKNTLLGYMYSHACFHASTGSRMIDDICRNEYKEDDFQNYKE